MWSKFHISTFSSYMQNYRNTKENNDGFTLVELIMSIIILAVITLIVFPILTNSMSISSDQSLRSHAINTITSTVETIRYSGDNSCEAVVARSNSANDQRHQDSRGREYTVRTETNGCDNSRETLDLRVYALHDGDEIAEIETKIFTPLY